MAESTSSSFSSSTSTPVVVQTPQSNWSLQLSQLLQALGNSQYQWAMNQVQNGQAITNQSIANFMDTAGKGAGLADTLINQYKNQFSPEIQNYLDQAHTFNSEARQRMMMGRAESQVAQSMEAARNEIERKLQGYGVRPDDGKSQEIMIAGRLQDAAARAGAGTQAALDTADRGRAMTEKAIQFGQNVPGMATNAMNTTLQGIAGAQNANLGQQNAATALSTSAAPYMSAAAGALKLPNVGQQSTGSSTGQQQSSSPDKSGSSGSGSGRGTGGAGDGSFTGGRPDTQTGPNGSAPSASSFRNPYAGAGSGGAGILNFPDQGPGAGGSEFGDQGPELGQWGPFATPPQGPELDGTWVPQGPETGGQWSDQGPELGQWDASGADAGGADTGGYTPDTGGDYYDQSSMEDNSYGDFSGGGDDTDYGGGYDEGFARGGGVLPTSGGAVPRGASPSQGRQTDDIPARLNAGEYVIPRDVVAHQGTKFFNDLIAKSRKLRTGMAGPRPGATMKPALRMRPTFASRGVM